MVSFRVLSIILISLDVLLCDVYLHNPRGSNNRLNENGRNVRTNTRLFDSQNNNRGGYNVGNMHYLEGSKLQIEWTAQHSCADVNNHCSIILQYACGPNLRDGASTSRIPRKNSDCRNSDCKTDIRYGMHEDNEYYSQCFVRKRNYGLFTADQNLRGRNRAIFTRQNRFGARYGYECPEERDYYPYWYASPWKDIAILTNNAKLCKYYRTESANVKSRWECRVPTDVLQTMISKNQMLPNTRSACEKEINGTWTESKPHGIPAPECHEPQWTRDNQLGNTISGYMPSFNWTIPSGENTNHLCALRVRYNISTSDYNGQDTFADGIKPADFASKFGFKNTSIAASRGYRFKGNPTVQPFAGNAGKKLELQLAINTNQYGRVFQDRSHGFFIKPTSVSDGVIHNLNVRGKRGNIVQVYPSVEYDFTPNTLDLGVGDYVHFQWTGSNNNNENNDGQGRAGSDRNNVLLQASAAFPQNGPSYKYQSYGHWGRSYPQFVTTNANTTMLGMSRSVLEHLAFSGTNMGDIEELDDAGTYFDLGPRKVTMAGSAHYMCTRNNNFSNRSQKGRLICTPGGISYHNVGVNGGMYSLGNGKFIVDVPQDLFTDLETFRTESWVPKEGEKLLREKGLHPPIGDSYASDYLKIGFTKNRLPGMIKISMKTSGSSSDLSVFRGNPDSLAVWERMNMKIESNAMVSFYTDRDGIFVVRHHAKSDIPLIIGMVVLSAVIVTCVGVLIYLERQKGILSSFTQNFRSKV